ncbi:hypothetical protein TSAR_012131 [Trichomalopsis sarcophagae]|uniref:Uncharacterized protein n=1 Tax=Trichomalopsis sarcophagae TaxID=543379 RepID=A0A232EMC3_9HYME|nr:hypothetical protein TSAR_012131 [Trichomalopsis sarcophagae]
MGALFRPGMKVLSFVMVDTFLFSIVIADDGIFMRLTNQSFRSSQLLSSLFHPHDTINPWSSRRIASNGPNYESPLYFQDSIASSNNQASRYIQKVYKPIDFDDNMMILEPIQRHRENSWADWMPDFFGDDSPPGPDPLIGPMKFPGIGKKVFIRQNEPLDEDTDRVVIHLIRREVPPPYGPPVTHESHLPQKYNQLPYYAEDPMCKKYDSSFLIHRKSFVFQQNNPFKMISEANFSADDEIFEVPNDPRYTVKFLKQSETNVPNAIWSRPLDHRGKYYGHKLNPAESKGPATFPYTNNTSFTSNNRSNLQQSKAPSNVLEQQYETLRRYGYQNNMRVVRESHSRGPFNPIQLSDRRPQDEMLHFEQPLNHLAKIILFNKAELDRKCGSGSFFDGSPIRTARNHYSATKHLMRSLASLPPILRQNFPVAFSGGLQVIPAPNLQRGPVSGDNVKDTKSSRNSTDEEVMHNIMSMTASQI